MFSDTEMQIDRIDCSMSAIAESPFLETNLLGLTLDFIESEIVAFQSVLDNFTFFTYADFECCECFSKWNRELQSDEPEESLQSEICPNCNDDNIIFSINHYKK